MKNRIFIVDDDPMWTAILSQILTNMGYENIITFENGASAVDNLHLNPEIVFLDYQMDDMDGLEVLSRIKGYYPGIQVIFCTAYEDLNIAVNAIENGSVEYLLKGNATKSEVQSILVKVEENQSTINQVG